MPRKAFCSLSLLLLLLVMLALVFLGCRAGCRSGAPVRPRIFPRRTALPASPSLPRAGSPTSSPPQIAAIPTAALLLFGILPPPGPIDERCDVMELNHFYDEQGRLVFDQVVFYDWSPRDERHQVRAWRLFKSRDQVPRRDWSGGGYVAVWFDGELLRRVRAQSCCETWTQFDPELVEREKLPKERRLELLGTVKPLSF